MHIMIICTLEGHVNKLYQCIQEETARATFKD